VDEATTGNALGWLLWTVQTLIIVVGGLLLVALFSYFNKHTSTDEISSRLADEDVAPS
jgi:hypothetical protein